MMKKGMVQKFLALPFSARQSALARKRPPLSYSDFVSSITRLDGDQEAASLIYSKLQDWVYHEDFTPYPDDSLSSVFGIAEEELDEDIILDLFVKLGLSTPSQQVVEAFGLIDTATSVARLVAFARSSDEGENPIL
jgi:hypothetical protein